MSDCRIREAALEDIPGIARVRVDTWRATYRGMVPDDFLDALSHETTAEVWRKTFWENRDPGTALFVAESDRDGIVGIAVCGPERNNDPLYKAEIYACSMYSPNIKTGASGAGSSAPVSGIFRNSSGWTPCSSG